MEAGRLLRRLLQVRDDGGTDQGWAEKVGRHLLRILLGSQIMKELETTHKMLATENAAGVLCSVSSGYCWYLSAQC